MPARMLAGGCVRCSLRVASDIPAASEQFSFVVLRCLESLSVEWLGAACRGRAAFPLPIPAELFLSLLGFCQLVAHVHV